MSRTPPAAELTVPRYGLTVAYDGTAYHGFQLQAEGFDTVAGRLEAALAGFAPEAREGGRVPVVGASRTDAGVHAKGQFFAFSSLLTVPLDRLPLAFAGGLPPDIVVLTAGRVPTSFDPRRDAIGKTYAYHVWRSPLPSPFWRGRSLHHPQRLELDACREALAGVPGTRDFAAFRDTGSSALTTVRTVARATLSVRPVPDCHPPGGEIIRLEIAGDGFLYHMVRIIVGTLLEVGTGRLPPGVIARALAGGRREDLGPTAPAHGLCLEKVDYPPGLVNPAPVRP